MTKINLLPSKGTPQARKGRPPRLTVIVATEVALLLVAAVYSGRYFAIKDAQRETEHIRVQIAAMTQDLEMLNQARARTRQIEEILSEVDALVASGQRPVPVLREARAIVPGDVWLASFSVEPDGSASLSGSTFEMESVARFSRQLVHSPLFDSVQVGAVRLSMKSGEPTYDFSMKCSVGSRR